MYTRNYSSRYTEKAYSGENTAHLTTEQTERLSTNPENSGQTKYFQPNSENITKNPPFLPNSEKQSENTAHFTDTSEKTHPQTAEIDPEIQIAQEIRDQACDDEQSEIIETSIAHTLPRKCAVRTFRVRSSPKNEPISDEIPSVSECDESKTEAFDVTRNSENDEKSKFCESERDEQQRAGSDTRCISDNSSACGDEGNADDSAFRHPPKHRPFHKSDRNGERSFFPSNAFGLKNLSYEDIFLCAIMLLLINEGCEDIMILILGFLLVS